MNNLLIDEYPLIVIPSLAKKIGLNEAILLQQIHFWVGKQKHKKDGRYWVYNTYDEWMKQFPFWSKSTIRRTITSLEKKKLLIVGNYNKLGIDNTKWYTIDYHVLQSMSRPPVQNEQMECSKWTGGHVQNEQTITIDYPETNNIDIYTLFDHWNSKEIIRHRKMNQAMQSHINARLQEYSKEELEKAIDNYSTILKSDNYYWTHKWSLQDFMKPNNVTRFTDEAKPLDNFKSSKRKSNSKEIDWSEL